MGYIYYVLSSLVYKSVEPFGSGILEYLSAR